MGNMFLYQEIDNAFKFINPPELPSLMRDNLASHIELREYQEKAFQHFLTYYENDKLSKNKQIHTLFHMATGERVIIVIGCINTLISRVSGTFIKNNSCIA